VDTPNRDSLACDLMEPARPQIDAYVLDWITRQPLKRDWFFEQRDGNCRLVAPLAVRLSETAPTWGRTVAPFAEWTAQALWDSIRKPPSEVQRLPTRLTQQRRSESRGAEFVLAASPAPRPQNVCLSCGASTGRGRHCAKCGKEVSGKKLTELAKVGRVVAQTAKSQRKRSQTQQRHEAAKRRWRTSVNPTWPSENTYQQEIQPRLASVRISILASALGVSESYAADIRAGRRRPHPRHWLVLAELLSTSPPPSL